MPQHQQPLNYIVPTITKKIFNVILLYLTFTGSITMGENQEGNRKEWGVVGNVSRGLNHRIIQTVYSKQKCAPRNTGFASSPVRDACHHTSLIVYSCLDDWLASVLWHENTLIFMRYSFLNIYNIIYS